MIAARIMSVGLMGPGLPDWPAGCGVLRGDVPGAATATVDPPSPEGLSSRERRRTSPAVRLALAVAHEAVAAAGENPKALPTVLGWPHGDGSVMQRLLETLTTPERYVSPTDFHNCVHNVAVGYWTIASGSHQPCSSIAAALDTFPAALLKAIAEVACEGRPVLLIACAVPFPEPLNSVCPVGAPFGVAMVLAPPDAAGGLARLTAAYGAGAGEAATRPETPALRSLWERNAAARAVPVLECLARRRAATVAIPYGPAGRLTLDVSPC